jgi:hypothetical protein
MERPVAASFSSFRDSIESPALQAVADHWQAVRGGRRMPSWTDLRPSCIAPHLTRIWSFRYDRATGEFTARLAGNQITLGFGMSFRGTPLRDMYPPAIFEQVQTRLSRLVLSPSIYRSCGKLFRVNGYIGEGERIVLPLASDGENGDGALGASDYPSLPTALAQGPIETMHEREEWFSLI